MPEHDDEDDQELREARARLAAELRRIREAADKTTREIGDYSSTQISMAERGLSGASKELIEEYVKIGGDRASLLTMLDDVRQASEEHERKKRLKRHGRNIATPQILPDANPMEIRRTYRIDLMDDFYPFNANRVPAAIDHMIRVRALTPDVNYFVMSYAYNVDKRPGVLEVEPTSGCRLERVTETEFGSLNFVLAYDRTQPVEERDIFEFSYRLHVNSTVPSRPLTRGSSRSGVGRCIRRVQFDLSDLPTQVWWFREPEILATENPPQPDRILPPNSTGRYQREFASVLREFYGLAWLWRDE